jgi:iron complex transport system substrate-binding protein
VFLKRSVCGFVGFVGVCCALACSGPSAESATLERKTASSAIRVTDDAGATIQLRAPARRIVSLVPSATETLIALGATAQLVGRTRYDVAPEVASLPSVGGTVDPSVEAIVNLRPDLVISWEADKRQATREKLMSLGIRVFVLRMQDTTDIFRGIARLGHLSGHDSAAASIAAAVRDTLAAVRRAAAAYPSPSVFYVVFNDPPMTAGPNTFLGELIALAGGKSIFADSELLWPNVAMEEIVRRDPDMLVVPVGEFRANAIERFRKQAGWKDLRAVRTGRVVDVPSDLLSRPSPRIAKAAQVLLGAFHPGVSPVHTGVQRP